MAKKAKYEDQINELEQIIDEIEDASISIDDLSTKVKRAAELIKSCKAVLAGTEKSVAEILESLNKDGHPS